MLVWPWYPHFNSKRLRCKLMPWQNFCYSILQNLKWLLTLSCLLWKHCIAALECQTIWALELLTNISVIHFHSSVFPKEVDEQVSKHFDIQPQAAFIGPIYPHNVACLDAQAHFVLHPCLPELVWMIWWPYSGIWKSVPSTDMRQSLRMSPWKWLSQMIWRHDNQSVSSDGHEVLH